MRRTGRACGAMGGVGRLGGVVFEPLGRSPSGCSRAALFGGGCVRVVSGEGMGTVGMQRSREREGKPVGEGEGNTVGMQPSAKAEGKSVVEGEADWPRLRRDGGVGRLGRLCLNRLVAALRAAPARLCLAGRVLVGFVELRFGVWTGVEGQWFAGREQARLGCSPRASARGNPLGRARATRLGCSPRPRPRGNPLSRARRTGRACGAMGRVSEGWGGCV
ncbi:MAG: hypothetical protein KatS3mg005_0026 [Bryobacteraceae bacterium]|nr:MAG: hypothetical protein KatS3mg005_0026 [Bryobacteraceae bacterium]